MSIFFIGDSVAFNRKSQVKCSNATLSCNKNDVHFGCRHFSIFFRESASPELSKTICDFILALRNSDILCFCCATLGFGIFEAMLHCRLIKKLFILDLEFFPYFSAKVLPQSFLKHFEILLQAFGARISYVFKFWCKYPPPHLQKNIEQLLPL